MKHCSHWMGEMRSFPLFLFFTFFLLFPFFHIHNQQPHHPIRTLCVAYPKLLAVAQSPPCPIKDVFVSIYLSLFAIVEVAFVLSAQKNNQ